MEVVKVSLTRDITLGNVHIEPKKNDFLIVLERFFPNSCCVFRTGSDGKYP